MAGVHTQPSKVENLDDCKGQIWRLYKVDKKPLRQVIKIIESEHGLEVSKWKVKAKLEQWKFRKNVKRKDLFDALRESDGPCLPDYNIQADVRRPVDRKAILKYAKRNQIHVRANVLGLWQEMERLETARPSQPFDLTNAIAIPERFLHDVRNLVQGSFEADTWGFNGNDSIIRSSTKQRFEMKALHDFLAEIDIGCTVAKSGDKDLSFRHWDKAFSTVSILIKGRYHDHLPNIIQKLNDLKAQGYGPVALSLQNHINQLGRICVRKGYTFSAVYTHLAELDLADLEEIEERLMALFQTYFEFYLGETCYNSFVMMMNLANRRLSRHRGIGLDDALPSLRILETKFGPTDRRALDVLRLRLEILLAREEYNEMIKEGPFLIARANRIMNDPWLQSYFATKGYYLLGTAQRMLGDYLSAYETLMKADFQEQDFCKTNGPEAADIFSHERFHIQKQLAAIEAMILKPDGAEDSQVAVQTSDGKDDENEGDDDVVDDVDENGMTDLFATFIAHEFLGAASGEKEI